MRPNHAVGGARRSSRQADWSQVRRANFGGGSARPTSAAGRRPGSRSSSSRMQQARIGHDGHDIRDQVEQDIGARKN